jgi:hypothetical protein
VGCQEDLSQASEFREPKAGKVYFSPLALRDQSEPHLVMALAEGGPDAGVTVAYLSLKLVWDVVMRTRVGQSGYAYVVDAQGLLVAHPDINMVLQRTDFSTLPQVRTALRAESRSTGQNEPLVGHDLQGRSVLATWERAEPPGWTVVVEQPLEDVRSALWPPISLASGQ